MTDFVALEDEQGVRLSWNIWPSSKTEAIKSVIPFASLYTPIKKLASMPVLPYEPIPCKQCNAILSPYARVDFYSKVWICPFCIARNHFPPHYQGVAENNLPAELYPNYTTVEYTLNRTVAPHPPVYIFVIDTCVSEEELSACKNTITQAISTLPEYVNVGLVTFGRHVHVYELCFSECSKCFVFRGGREYTCPQIVDQLGVRPVSSRGPQGGPGGQQGAPNMPTRKFLMPLSEAEFALTTALEELTKDAFPVVTGHRPLRCTGTALQVASALLGASVPSGNCQARIMTFLGGPCTEGGGKVLGTDLGEQIRSHKDVAKDGAPHFRKAKKFYEVVSQELVQHGHTVDVFAMSLDQELMQHGHTVDAFARSLDQVGFAEMRDICMATGGMAVQASSFTSPVFKNSLQRLLLKEGEEGFVGLSSNATIEVIPSKDIKVAGLLGTAARMEKKSPNISDNEIGMGGTTQWKLCSLDLDTTVSVFFDITANNKEGEAAPQQGSVPQFFIQFITRYMHWGGELRCRVTTLTRRVTTLTRRWVDPGPQLAADLISGFDQEAAAVIMARLASHKMDTEEDFDATRLFMFILRRSQFVQVFGNSPDETAYFRLLLFRVTTSDAMLMIQPQLTAYHFNGPPEPVLLDVQSILPERILFLDAYFYVVIFHGTTIAQWRKAEYHLKEGIGRLERREEARPAPFAQLWQKAKGVVLRSASLFHSLADCDQAGVRLPPARESGGGGGGGGCTGGTSQGEAKKVLRKRFPEPYFVDCGSFLLAKLNPSSTYSSPTPMSAEVINTDDVSLSTFTEHLKRLAVQSGLPSPLLPNVAKASPPSCGRMFALCLSRQGMTTHHLGPK
eukprot:gene5189-18413_t